MRVIESHQSKNAAREKARLAGEKFFTWARGCKYGHTVFYTSNTSCVDCATSGRKSRRVFAIKSFEEWAADNTNLNLTKSEKGCYYSSGTRYAAKVWLAAKRVE